MPWYSSNSAATARDNAAELTTSSDMHRRAVSLDLNRLSAAETSRNALLGGLIEEEPGKKAKRSSFARLSASWRFGGRSNPDANKDDELTEDQEGGVELQPGFGTEYSATGLKGGFVISPSASDASSSLYRASSSTRSYASTRPTEEDYDEEPYIRSPPPRKPISPSPQSSGTAERGFADFSPASIVIEEEERRNKNSLKCEIGVKDSAGSSVSPATKPNLSIHRAQCKAESPPASPTISKKSKSRGWFSFSSSANTAEAPEASTPNEVEHVTPPASSVAAPRLPLRPHTKVDIPNTAACSPSPKPVSKLRLPSTSIGRSVGRKRGDSEVSMKDLTAV